MKRHEGATGKNDQICSFSENNLPIIRSNQNIFVPLQRNQ